MSKRELIFAAAGVAVGGAVGFAIGCKALKKKVEKSSQEKLDREMQQVNDLEEKLHEKIKEVEEESKSETEPSEDDISEYAETIDDLDYNPEDEDMDEETADIYSDEFQVTQEPVKHRKPKVLGKEPKDPNDPDLEFDQEELYYYMSNELLIDDNGNPINETDYIGNDLRRYGFMRGNGTLDYTWVRNYDHQVDYLVHRYASPDDSFMEEQDE